MWRNGKKDIFAGVFAAFVFGAAGTTPVTAQSIPIIPPIAPNINLAGCPVVSGLSGCIGAAIPGPSGIVVVVPGIDQRGGPRHEEGGRDVDVDRDTHEGRAVAR